jgi:hypothetical protein
LQKTKSSDPSQAIDENPTEDDKKYVKNHRFPNVRNVPIAADKTDNDNDESISYEEWSNVVFEKYQNLEKIAYESLRLFLILINLLYHNRIF